MEKDKGLTEEQKKFAEENHNLIYSFLMNKKLNFEEYYDIVAIGFCKAVKAYEPSRGPFSTYAYSCMMNEVKMHWRKTEQRSQKYGVVLISLNEPIIGIEDLTVKDTLPHPESVESLLKYERYLEIINSLPPPMDEVVNLSIQGYSQSEIAQKMGYSQSYVSRLLTKAYQRIKDCGL